MEAPQYNELKTRIDEIHAALIGNPITNDGGLVRKVDKLEGVVEDLKTFKDRSKWTASILIGVAGICGWCADKILDLFIKH